MGGKLIQLHNPAVIRADALFGELCAFSRDIVKNSSAAFGEEWERAFGVLLNNLFGDPESLSSAIKGYASFSLDSMRRQKQFERVGRYAATTFEQASHEVYFNEQHMLMEYLPGLLLSHYLWPHHYRQLVFFQEYFIQPMIRDGAGTFVEIGVGTGLYSRLVLDTIERIKGVGFDISPFSKLFAENHIRAFGLDGRYDVRLHDILKDSSEDRFPRLICVEVLEHLEDPVEFLRNLRSLLEPSGKAFITAALNAAHADHIYLYRDVSEVSKHVQTAGFTVEQCYLSNAYQPRRSDVPVPAAAALIVTA